MYWYYFIYGLVLCGVVPSLINDEQLRHSIQRLYFPFVLFALAIFAGIRSPGVDGDYGMYLDWFNSVAAGNLAFADWVKDPAFVLISITVSSLGWSYVGVAVAYAAIALISQFCFSKMALGGRWVALLFYLIICSMFIISDMTQIRTAVAIPIMSLGILLAVRGQRKSALLLYAISIAFHLSALIGLPSLLIAMLNRELRSRWWILSLIPGAILAKIAFQNDLVVFSEVSRLSVYLNGSYSTESIRLLSVYFVVRILAVSFVTIFYWRRISKEGRLVTFCSSVGLFIQVVLSFNDALGMRGAAIFALFDACVFMIPLQCLKGNFRTLYAVALIVLGFVFFHSSLKIIGSYQWSLS